MEQLWKQNLRQIEPYVPGEQSSDPDRIKLNANENPYPPAPGVEAVLRSYDPVSYTHLRAHETGRNLVCRLLLEKKKKQKKET